MKIVSAHYATDHGRHDIGLTPVRDTMFLDHIGGELRGLYGDVEAAPLPASLSVLLALLDAPTNLEIDGDHAA